MHILHFIKRYNRATLETEYFLHPKHVQKQSNLKKQKEKDVIEMVNKDRLLELIDGIQHKIKEQDYVDMMNALVEKKPDFERVKCVKLTYNEFRIRKSPDYDPEDSDEEEEPQWKVKVKRGVELIVEIVDEPGFTGCFCKHGSPELSRAFLEMHYYKHKRSFEYCNKAIHITDFKFFY